MTSAFSRSGLQLFGCDHANVQPHSGAQANMSVYLATCHSGDVVFGMDLL